MQRKEVITTSKGKQTKVFGNEEPLEKDKTENSSENTKEDNSENSQKN